MNQNEKIFLSLGYRKMKDNIYGKPIGYSLLIIDTNQNKWFCWFKGKDSEIHLWQSAVIDITNNEELLNHIKDLEVYNTKLIYNKSNFEFLTGQDNLIL